MRAWRFVVPALAACALLCVSAPTALAYQISGVDPNVPFGTHVRTAQIAANLNYYGGPVMHSNRTHVIFWNPSNRSLTWDAGYQSTIEGFLANVAADSRQPTNVMSLTGQYGDGLGRAEYNSTYAGSIQDTDPAPADGCAVAPVVPDATMCLTDAQLRTEIATVVNNNHLPTGLGDVYLLATPRHFGTCTSSASTNCEFNQYCAYHSALGSASSPLIYTNQPYEAVPGYCRDGMPQPNGPVDRSITSISHEISEAITDPLPAGAGGSSTGWVDASNQENGDLCSMNYGPTLGGSGSTRYNQVIHGAHYFTQNEWSNEDNGGSCQPHDEINAASSSIPSTAKLGVSATVSASSADPDGSISQYLWSFGDGGVGVGSSTSHAYRHSGTFTVTLVAIDAAGNIATSTRTIAVGPLKLSISLKGHKLRIGVPVGGTAKVGKKTKGIGGAGKISFKLRLSTHQLQQLHHGHKVKIKLKVRFVSAAGEVVTKTVKVTLKH